MAGQVLSVDDFDIIKVTSLPDNLKVTDTGKIYMRTGDKTLYEYRHNVNVDGTLVPRFMPLWRIGAKGAAFPAHFEAYERLYQSGRITTAANAWSTHKLSRKPLSGGTIRFTVVEVSRRNTHVPMFDISSDHWNDIAPVNFTEANNGNITVTQTTPNNLLTVAVAEPAGTALANTTNVVYRIGRVKADVFAMRYDTLPTNGRIFRVTEQF